MSLQRWSQAKLQSIISSSFLSEKEKINGYIHTSLLVCINIGLNLKTTDTLEIKMLFTLIGNANFCA